MSVKIDILALLGISIHLKIQQWVSILTLSFSIGLDKWIFVGK